MELKLEQTMYGDKQLGSKFKEIRKKKNITQKQMADSLEVTQGYISKIESGESMPNVSLLKNLRRIYKTNLSKLICQ